MRYGCINVKYICGNVSGGRGGLNSLCCEILRKCSVRKSPIGVTKREREGEGERERGRGRGRKREREREREGVET